MYVQCHTYTYNSKYYLFFFFLQHLSKTTPRIEVNVMTTNKTANEPAMMAPTFVLLTCFPSKMDSVKCKLYDFNNHTNNVLYHMHIEFNFHATLFSK